MFRKFCVLLFISISFARHLQDENLNVTGIDKYGNWCGGGHGGLQDCCNGGKCPSCNQGSGPTSACLNECPPVVCISINIFNSLIYLFIISVYFTFLLTFFLSYFLFLH